jgi:hypothetical protein
VDVYSFTAKAGTEVWIDLDRTWHALDPVVELIDNLGNVLARSQDSTFESLGNGTAGNIGRRMQKTPPYEGVDQYTTNYRDPGMRLVLPGPANSSNTYHIRIRSGAGAQITSARGGVFVAGGQLVAGGPRTVNTATQGGNGVNEVQDISLVLGAQTVVGSFTLTFNGQTTALLPVNATNAQIQTALEALSNIAPGDVLVTGLPGLPSVEFRGAYAGQNVNPMIQGINEVQFLPIPGAGLPGSFAINFGPETTAQIPNTATPTEVQAALEALNAFAPGDVFVTQRPGLGGTNLFTFEFRGPFSNQDVATMISANTNPNEFQRVDLLGAPTGGTFTLTFQGQTTAPLAYNASFSDVHAALAALPAIGGAANIAVTGPPGGAWDVEFRGALANTDVPSLTANTDTLVGGLTEGAYQAQIRLREVDEFGGSTVRFANIKYAQNGIRVLGQPTHSPLAGEHTEVNDAANNAQGGAQNLGNLLTNDRGTLSVAGNIAGAGDIDWFQMNVNYAATQGIPGISTTEDWWSTIFDIDYADGFARPNVVISIFDSAGNLVLSSRDSNIADDRPIPVNPSDVSDLSRGSSGAADPFIGPVELVQGTYFVAISSDNRMPQIFDQFTSAASASPLIRLEPIDSVQRIVEEHISGNGGSTGTDPVVPDFITADSFMPWSFHDVTLFVSRDLSGAPTNANNTTQILTVDPFSGLVETTVGNFGRDVRDIAMHPGGRLYTYTVRTEFAGAPGFADALVGNYLQIDTGNGSITQIGDDGIATYMADPASTAVPPPPVLANDVNGQGDRRGEGVHFRAIEIASFPGNQVNGGILGLAVGGRDPANLALGGALGGNGSDLQNILYAFNPDTGAALSNPTSNRAIDASVLPGPTNPGTQVVERGILNTLVDSNPVGNADVIQVAEATIVDLVTGATTFNIMDDYPPTGRPPEIPPTTTLPDPTTFSITYGGPATTFEFDAGPEALININPNNPNQTIRDGQGFRINGGTLVEFDTGHVINVTSGAVSGNFADGTTFTLVSPDPTGGAATIPTIFEFDTDGNVAAGNVQVPTNGRTTPALMSTAIVTAINTSGLTTVASILSGTQRITLANNTGVFPSINPMADTDVTIGTSGMAIAIGGAGNTAPGVAAGSVAVRIEETSTQAQLAASLLLANNVTINPTSANRPANAIAPGGFSLGVSSPNYVIGGDNKVTIGFDGNRLNLSGALTISNAGLVANVFRTVGSQGGISPIPVGRVPVPFLAQDDAPTVATRMAAAINNRFPLVPQAFAQGTTVVAPTSNVVSADPPLQAAAQAPGGVITGMTAVQDFDANGVVISTDIYVVTDTGGLFRVVNAFSTGNATLDYINSATDLLGIEFSGLEVGPANVEGNRYREMLFGVTDDGVLHAFSVQGILQPIFNSTFVGGQMTPQSSMQLQSAGSVPLTGVHGLRFSTLDSNLWANGGERVPNDPGHGLNTLVDDSRARTRGGTTLRFGGYNQPGGAHGTLESEPFSLKGYSAADQPTLYYSYFLDSENVQHGPGANNGTMRDALRVFVAGDDGDWQLLTTSDSARLPGTTDDDFDYSPRVQETWDDTGNWRQVRVTLADFAGMDNLRIRFDYSTAGSMNIGDQSTPVVGDELRAVDGIWLRDQQTFTLSAGGDTVNPERTFEFDMGYTLVAPNGARIPDGARMTINGVPFEFNSAGGVGGGFTAINYLTTDSPEQVAANIDAALAGALPALPVQVNGNRLNLRGGAAGAVTGATSVVLSGPAMPAGFVEGAPGVVTGIQVNVHAGMTRDEVREAIALVMTNVYGGGDRAQIKTHNEVIRLIGSNYPLVPPTPPALAPPQYGYRFVDQDFGPFADALNQRLLGVTLQLPGDQFGSFNSNLRGQNNADEGVYIDDIIIGFAERGEMVSGPGRNNTAFVPNPNASITNVTQGLYQLEARRAAEAGEPNGSTTIPRLDLLPSIDTNDRLDPSRTLVAPFGYEITDGQFFTLSDGINQVTFEFNDLAIPGSGVQPGRIRIDYRINDPDYVIAQRIRTAINTAPVQAVIKVSAQLSDGIIGTASTDNRVNLIGAVNIPVAGGLFFELFTEQYGDRNLFRDQGQIILYGNEISNSAQWGILVDNGARSAADGQTPHQGPVRNLREPNTERLVPGVVVTNNVVHRNTAGGIRFSGDANANNDAVIPFGRIVNNTLYGNGGTLTGGIQNDVGILVDNAAGPTLLNNIVANFNTGINVADAVSRNETVVGGTLYQGNRTDSNVALGGPGDFPIILANNEPLFVNAAVGNFYLKAQSRAIDSSVDSLLDRPGLVTVKNPMGIAVSPIISPDRDGVGQLRVDDPSVSTPNGFGLNPFKDRGAIDRVDFSGPNSILVNPQDNDSVGIDLDPAPTVVVLKSQILRDFTIRLIDRFDPDGPAEGSDIDDTSVDSSKVRIEVLTATGTTLLVEGNDYTFSYDTTNNLIRLTPRGGLWPLIRTYRITLDNSAATGISDRAGNILAPNQPDGTHIYTIFLGSAVDFGDAPDSYGTLLASNGPTHQIVGGIHLGATNGAEPDGQPSVGADLDVSDDGVTFGNLQPGGAANSSNLTVVSAAVGKLDGWFDLNQNGTFDPSEHILQGVNLVVGSTLINFTLPNGLRGNTYARFRMTTTGISTPFGPAADGEVEDYVVTMVGPEFQNGTLNVDVNNDGFVSPIDALYIINYLSTWLPIVNGNGFGSIPLPPRVPEFDAPVPVLDPTGGGVPGNGRYIDVNGDGILSSIDAIQVINYITNPPPAPAPLVGEGEGEGESPSAIPNLALASSSQSVGGRGFSSAALLVSPDIVIEERSTNPAPTSVVMDASVLLDSDDSLDLALLVSSSPLAGDDAEQALSLTERLQHDMPFGPLDDSAWDDLLSNLAGDTSRPDGQPKQGR